MNFNFTLIKTIISVVSGLILGIFSSKVCYVATKTLVGTLESSIKEGCYYEFHTYSVMGFIIGFIFLYSIFSLIQKSDN